MADFTLNTPLTDLPNRYWTALHAKYVPSSKALDLTVDELSDQGWPSQTHTMFAVRAITCTTQSDPPPLGEFKSPGGGELLLGHFLASLSRNGMNEACATVHLDQFSEADWITWQQEHQIDSSMMPAGLNTKKVAQPKEAEAIELLVRDVPLRVWTMWESWWIQKRDLHAVLMGVLNAHLLMLEAMHPKPGMNLYPTSLQAMIRTILKWIPATSMRLLAQQFAALPSANCIHLGQLISNYQPGPVTIFSDGPRVRDVPETVWREWQQLQPKVEDLGSIRKAQRRFQLKTEHLQFAAEAVLNRTWTDADFYRIWPDAKPDLYNVVLNLINEQQDVSLDEFAKYILAQGSIECIVLARAMNAYH